MNDNTWHLYKLPLLQNRGHCAPCLLHLSGVWMTEIGLWEWVFAWALQRRIGLKGMLRSGKGRCWAWQSALTSSRGLGDGTSWGAFLSPGWFLGAWMWDTPSEAALTHGLRTHMPVAMGVTQENQPWSKGSSGLWRCKLALFPSEVQQRAKRQIGSVGCYSAWLNTAVNQHNLQQKL